MGLRVEVEIEVVSAGSSLLVYLALVCFTVS